LKKLNIFLTTVFILFLILPIIDNIFKISPIKNLFEKRLPAEMPKNPKNFKEVKKYLSKFENFFNDNYGFRKSLVSVNSWIMDDIFNESPNDRALVGDCGG